MKIHREGFATLSLIVIFLGLINFILHVFLFNSNVQSVISILLSFLILFFFLQFFRLPHRTSSPEPNQILCPADGEIVVIEETIEDEYFKDKRLQVSVFMSPFNVHANWYPINGTVQYTKYHPGKFLVAWHPKSSTLNERSTVVLKNTDEQEILIRQIAGAVARRIVTYSKTGEIIKVNQELGFIKFGSRVDIFLPLGTKIKVSLKEKVTGNKTILAEF